MILELLVEPTVVRALLLDHLLVCVMSTVIASTHTVMREEAAMTIEVSVTDHILPIVVVVTLPLDFETVAHLVKTAPAMTPRSFPWIRVSSG